MSRLRQNLITMVLAGMFGAAVSYGCDLTSWGAVVPLLGYGLLVWGIYLGDTNATLENESGSAL